MAVINQINLVNNVGESETFDIETKITPAVRAYIQNQNKLSPMEVTPLGVGEANATVAQYDGFLILQYYLISNNGTQARYLFVNGQELDFSSVSQYAVSRQSFITLPVRKGDSFYVSNANFIQHAWFMYYKDRDYTE